MMRSLKVLAIALFCLVSLSDDARSHAVGESYVWLNVGENRFEGRFQLRLPDLREKLGIQISEDPDTARRQITESAPVVWEYLQEHFSIMSAGEKIQLIPERAEIFELENLGHYAQYFYRTADLEIPDRISVRNEIFFEDDRLHRALLLIESNAKTGEKYGGEFTVLIFRPSNSLQELDLTAVEAILEPRDFVWQGMLHIWVGIDHLLFLLTLLLPAVLISRSSERDETGADPPHFRAALWGIVKIVTLFTIAHSVTLTLAALDLVRLPPRFVESMIALSIIVVALNNTFPIFRATNWIIIFFFGLFHGLGFASVMGDLPFRMVDLVKVILAFNIGVEIGQIAFVGVVFPFLYWLARSRIQARAVVVTGSLAICMVATFWLFERAVDVSLW